MTCRNAASSSFARGLDSAVLTRPHPLRLVNNPQSWERLEARLPPSARS
jgi:hypothetical protein